jgi:hypothetical protein
MSAPQTYRRIRVFVSSPSDCESERESVLRVLDELNRTTGERESIFFSALRWEDMAPGQGLNPQAVIDEQLGAYDVLIGIMWLRFGTPIPGGAGSGTEHEVQQAIASFCKIGQPRVMFYFKEELVDPNAIDLVQFEKVRTFRQKLQQLALVTGFSGITDFETKLRVHLNKLITLLAATQAPVLSCGPELSMTPYDDFSRTFREMIAAYRTGSGSLLHLVFGNIADIRRLPMVIPINQDFDFLQRGPRGVLGACERIRVGERPFFDYLEENWPVSKRPRAAGLGEVRYVPLPANSQEIPGILFVVTTRDLSANSRTYGRYVNTPIEGIDITIDNIMSAVRTHRLESVCLPLLGTGYANIGRTWGNPNFALLLKRAAFTATIDKVQATLTDSSSPLRRAVVVVYSDRKSSPEEHELWTCAVRFLPMNPQQRRQEIGGLVTQMQRAEEGSTAASAEP